MKLINPSEISARILTLLEESEERVILVSPYVKISKWFKLQNKINDLRSRRIHPEIYVRDDPDNTSTFRDLDNLDLRYKMIPHLHSKFYMNERFGIVTSMNLLLSSEINSLEIGYETETWNEYNNLFAFYNRYIHKGDPHHCNIVAGHPVADLKEFTGKVREELDGAGKNSWLWFSESTLHISTGRNTYLISILDCYLRITASMKITTKTKQKSIQGSSTIAKKITTLSAIKVDIHTDPITESIELCGQGHYRMKSTCITVILSAEAEYITETVISFIKAADDLVY